MSGSWSDKTPQTGHSEDVHCRLAVRVCPCLRVRKLVHTQDFYKCEVRLVPMIE